MTVEKVENIDTQSWAERLAGNIDYYLGFDEDTAKDLGFASDGRSNENLVKDLTSLLENLRSLAADHVIQNFPHLGNNKGFLRLATVLACAQMAKSQNTVLSTSDDSTYLLIDGDESSVFSLIERFANIGWFAEFKSVAEENFITLIECANATIKAAIYSPAVIELLNSIIGECRLPEPTCSPCNEVPAVVVGDNPEDWWKYVVGAVAGGATVGIIWWLTRYCCKKKEENKDSAIALEEGVAANNSYATTQHALAVSAWESQLREERARSEARQQEVIALLSEKGVLVEEKEFLAMAVRSQQETNDEFQAKLKEEKSKSAGLKEQVLAMLDQATQVRTAQEENTKNLQAELEVEKSSLARLKEELSTEKTGYKKLDEKLKSIEQARQVEAANVVESQREEAEKSNSELEKEKLVSAEAERRLLSQVALLESQKLDLVLEKAALANIVESQREEAEKFNSQLEAEKKDSSALRKELLDMINQVNQAATAQAELDQEVLVPVNEIQESLPVVITRDAGNQYENDMLSQETQTEDVAPSTLASMKIRQQEFDIIQAFETKEIFGEFELFQGSGPAGKMNINHASGLVERKNSIAMPFICKTFFCSTMEDAYKILANQWISRETSNVILYYDCTLYCFSQRSCASSVINLKRGVVRITELDKRKPVIKIGEKILDLESLIQECRKGSFINDSTCVEKAIGDYSSKIKNGAEKNRIQPGIETAQRTITKIREFCAFLILRDNNHLPDNFCNFEALAKQVCEKSGALSSVGGEIVGDIEGYRRLDIVELSAKLDKMKKKKDPLREDPSQTGDRLKLNEEGLEVATQSTGVRGSRSNSAQTTSLSAERESEAATAAGPARRTKSSAKEDSPDRKQSTAGRRFSAPLTATLTKKAPKKKAVDENIAASASKEETAITGSVGRAESTAEEDLPRAVTGARADKMTLLEEAGASLA